MKTARREQPEQPQPCVESGLGCIVAPHSCDPFAMSEHCDNDNAFAPSGVEAHPEVGHEVPLNASAGRRFCGIMLFALLAVTCVVVGTVVGRRLQNDQPQPDALSLRATASIAETMQQFWQRHNLPFHGGSNGPMTPFEKALEWMQNVDPLALRPTDANLVQRFVLVYFYFATSTQQQPWTTECLVLEENSTSDDDCLYQLFHSGSTPRFAAYKWLSGRSECDWAGISCDATHQVIALEIGTNVCACLSLPVCTCSNVCSCAR
jgi:hypothetical protein